VKPHTGTGGTARRLVMCSTNGVMKGTLTQSQEAVRLRWASFGGGVRQNRRSRDGQWLLRV